MYKIVLLAFKSNSIRALFVKVAKDFCFVCLSANVHFIEKELLTEFYDVEGTKASASDRDFGWITDYAADLEDNSMFSYTIDDLSRDEKQADKLKAWKNASRLKHVKIADELIFLIYEIWDDSEFQYTAYMIVDEFGNIDT